MSDQSIDKPIAQASQARCADLPNDHEDHYWSWVNAPKSIPSQYKHCMICDRIDASEWHTKAIREARLNELNEAFAGAHPDKHGRVILNKHYLERRRSELKDQDTTAVGGEDE